MPNDPMNMDDPSHPLHGLSQGFAQMRQRRREYDARQQMMAQVLAASPGGMLGGGAGMAPLLASGWGGSSPAWSGQGLTGLAEALRGQQINSQKFGSGPDTSGGWFAANGGAKAPAALPMSSIPLGGMAKG